MQRFLDVVKINFSEDIFKCFDAIEIERVTSNKEKTALNFYVCVHSIIPYRIEKKAIEELIKELRVNDIKLNVKYILSPLYTPKVIFEETQADFIERLKEYKHTLATIFTTSRFVFINDKDLQVTFDKNEALKSEQDELIKIIKESYIKMYNIDLVINIIYDDLIKVKTVSGKSFYQNKLNEDLRRKEREEVISDELKEAGVPVKTEIKRPKNTNFLYNSDIIFDSRGKNRDSIKYLRVNLSQITEEKQNILTSGVLYKKSNKVIESKKFVNGEKKNLFEFVLVDGTDCVRGQIWGKGGDIKEVDDFNQLFNIGDVLEVKGDIKFDTYNKSYTLNTKCVTKIGKRDVIKMVKKKEEDNYNIIIGNREDNEKEKRVELHLHTKSSAQDAVGEVNAYVRTAHNFGMTAMAITDHGCVNALADAHEYIKECIKNKEKMNLKIINGMEGYLIEDFNSFYINSENKESERNYSIDSTFIVYDFITTGFNKKNDSVIKIVANKVENGKVTASYQSFVKSKKPLSYLVKERTGIFDENLIDADDFNTALIKFLDFGGDSIYVPATRNTTFSLSSCMKLFNINRMVDIIDLQFLSRLMLPDIKTEKLTTIAKELKIKDKNLLDFELATKIFISLIDIMRLKYNLTDILQVKDKFTVNDDFIKRQKYYHIILLAKNDVGRVNLYKLVSDSHINYMYKDRPRIPRSLLNKYREGLIIGSACILGEFMDAIKDGKDDEELKKIASYYDYLEIQPTMNNSFLLKKDSENFKSEADLQKLNEKVIEIADSLGKLVCATTDCHYIEKEDKIFRDILRFGVSGKKSNFEKDGKLKEDVASELEDSSDELLYFRTTKEMLDEFSYLGVNKAYEVVVKNTNIISDMIEDIMPLRPDKCAPHIDGWDEELINTCNNNLKNYFGDDIPLEIKTRMDSELSYINDNGYSVMYISAKKLIDHSKEWGYPVGSRGSVGSSLAATFSGVTDVNPLKPFYVCPRCHHVEYDTEETKKYNNETGFDMPDKACPKCTTLMEKNGVNIPFETFLGIPGKANKEPDIDLNFGSSKGSDKGTDIDNYEVSDLEGDVDNDISGGVGVQTEAHNYTRVLFGEKNTFKAGTVGTVATKTAYGYTLKYKEAKELSLNREQIDYFASKVTDCKKNTGQHAGGMIVVPEGEEIYTFTPIQTAANKGEIVTTHFDYHKIDNNLLKLDLLGHEAPLRLKMLSDLSGVKYSTVPFYEKEVIDLFMNTESLNIKPEDIGGTKLGCLSIPEFGTDFAIDMCLDAKPKNVADLIRISGLAHGTDVWQGNVQDLIKAGTCTLQNAICCRDDIMLYLIDKGLDSGLAFNIMELVRKGKGKKLSTEELDEMRKHGVPEWYIECCIKIKYMFPKAHAAAYVMQALQIAYYKVHYPLEYYATLFSIDKDGLVYELIMGSKEKIRYYIERTKKRNDELMKKKHSSNDIEEKTEEEKNEAYLDSPEYLIDKITDKKQIENLFYCLRNVEEMLARGIEFMPLDVKKARAHDFRIIDGKIMPSFDSFAGVSGKALKCEIEARLIEEGKKEPYSSIENFIDRTKLNKTVVDKMRKYGLLNGLRTNDEVSLTDFI